MLLHRCSLVTTLLLVSTLVASVSVCPLVSAAASWPPISTRQPPFQSIVHPLPLTTYWSKNIQAPYPTNAWWMNIVLLPATQPITISPLAMRIETADIQHLRPFNRTAEYEHCTTDRTGTHCPSWSDDVDPNSVSLPIGGTIKRGCNFGLGEKHVNADMIATFFQPGFVISAKETLTPHQVAKFDALSVTMQFTEQGQPQNRVEFPLVRGMPYATAVYTSMTPYLFTLNAILAINEQDLPGVVKGNKLRMKINNEQVVLVYAWKNGDDEDDEDENELQWKWDRNTVELVGPGAAKGNWVVRLAFIPKDAISAPGPEQIYDKYSGTYPTGGEWDYEFGHEATETLNTMIDFKTASQYDPFGNDTDPSAAELLMFSLPHHQATFVQPRFVDQLSLDTLVGSMVGVLGTRWLMARAAVPASYTSFRAHRAIDPSRVNALKMQILSDIQSSSTAGEPDPYGFGKSLSKLGRLALIAEELHIDSGLIEDLVAKMKDFVAPWLDASNPDQLLYDETYGGIVSTNGVRDAAQDFGQGYYNDHHFHYGYLVYGCSVIAHFDPVWAASYSDSILSLARDYANPSSSDSFFPVLRQFDIFDGHSWAAGLFVFADGRNQESSSESINGYYALMLLGTSISNPQLADFGRMLATLEIEGTQAYWHSRNGKSVYPDVFAKNKCIGMKWSDKVVEATWFAAGMVYIHGINMLPFTPLSELYLDAAWVKEEYPVVISSVTSDITDEWKGFLFGTHCVIDSKTAWSEIQGLTSFDGGNTRSNLMYFCATRPTQHEAVQLVEEAQYAPIRFE